MTSRYPELALYVNGAWRPACGRDTEAVLNPATEEMLASVPHATHGDLDDALGAVAKAAAHWRSLSPTARSDLLRRAAALVRERADHIAAVMLAELGKTLAECRFEALLAAEVIEWSAEEGRRLYGRIIPPRDPSLRQSVLHEPVGPVAAFCAWNFPAVFPARKISEALAAGCTIVIKPSEETPGTAVEIVRAFHDAGVPAGVLNLVFGSPPDISQRLLQSSVIRKVTLTGSVPVGKQLATLAAQSLIRCTLELGGHAPVIVFDDVDVEKVAGILTDRKVRLAGQACNSPSRFLIHEAIYERFMTAFGQRMASVRVGPGELSTTQMGPLLNRRRISAMDSLVEDSGQHGASIVCGGERLPRRGFFYAPTVLGEVPTVARVMNEEPFGPIAACRPFETTDEAIAEANRLDFGLAAYVFTRSAERAALVGSELEAGLVGLNSTMIALAETPFGGVKASGYGSEGGSEGVEGYLNTKYVVQAWESAV